MLSGLASKTLTLALLAGLALVLIPATFSRSPLFLGAGRLLLVLLTVNLALCTSRHWRRLPWCVILIHGGILTILLGTLWSQAGFVATVNIHEGGASSTAFRWDREEDTPLGFTLKVNTIHQDYYPVAIKVGVLREGRPERLFEVKTGEAFSFAGYRVEVLALDPTAPALNLAVIGGDGVRTLRTLTREIDHGQEGLVLQLVAFQTPRLQRGWVDLEITPEVGPSLSGETQVNHPLHWQGLRLFHTATGIDPGGRRYAGIQIVKDQGIPLVYGGFLLLTLGNGLLLLARGGRRRKPGEAKGQLRS